MMFFDIHENARAETKAFVEKCTRVLDGFRSVRVPGDGYCMSFKKSKSLGLKV